MNKCLININTYMIDIDNELRKQNCRLCWVGDIISIVQKEGKNVLYEVKIPIMDCDTNEPIYYLKFYLPKKYIIIP